MIRGEGGGSWRPGFEVALPVTTGAHPQLGPRVAYVAMTDTGFDLFTARPDGTGVRRLTTTGGVAAPEWSPDHRTLAFTVRSRRGGYSLWTVRADGHRLRRVTGVGYQSPELGVGARRASAGVRQRTPPVRVHAGEPGARVPQDLRQGRRDRLHPSSPPAATSWSSASPTTPTSPTSWWSAARGPVRRLTRLRGSELDPSWSPRGDRIAFTLALGGQFDRRRRTTVMTVRADGTHPRVLLATAGLDDGPAWSPDGRRVVVRSDGPRGAGGTAQPGMWVVDASGRHLRLAVPGRGIAYVDW